MAAFIREQILPMGLSSSQLFRLCGLRCPCSLQMKSVARLKSFYIHDADDSYVTTTGMFNNLYLKINESQTEMYQNDSGWKMLIHDEKDSPLIDIRTHGSTLYQGWAKDVRIYIRDVTLSLL